ncbi:MAG TPA: translocation/assembly module TamB domain-containing protein, partial [Chitinophagaceae bacterium]|nr:translocation/assembly module TamB domain-containing protein [Chitinophagaceae bacterium]
KTQPFDFTVNAYILDNPALKVFVPGLTQIDSVSIQAHLSDQNGWTASVKAPYIELGPNRLRNLELKADTEQGEIRMITTIESLASGPNMAIDNTTLRTFIANNTIDFGLNIKNDDNTDIYNINGLVQQPQSGNYQIALSPDSLLLNYAEWTISNDNRILITPLGINAKNFELSNNGQRLSINSLNANPNAPLDVNFEQFRLATLTGFVQTDSTLANGVLSGKITFNELANEPVFVGDLSVNDLSLRGDTVGNVKILVNNRVPGTYAADIALSGRGNDVGLTGNYYLKSGDSNFDFDLDIREMPMATAAAFSNEMFRDASGSMNGKFDIQGTIAKPEVRGNLNFNKARFNLSMLNNYFTIDQEKISVDEQGIVFDNFEIRDTSQNTLRIDGVAATKNFTNYEFDLAIRARDFQALNSTKKDNKLFYGKLFFNTNLQVKGTEATPVIDGRLVVNEKTSMTVVLPQREPGVVQREGIIEFVDMDATLSDSLFMAPYDSLNTAPYTGMEISVNVEIDKEAEFSLVIDEGNGDFLNVKGEALLTAGIDPSGKVNMAGTYELEQGSYELTFNFVKRKFDIEKGSRIVWEGEPTDARVDINAVYVANAAPLDLVKNQLEEATAFERNTYMQKLPFDVHLKMEGELLKPEISFDIILPEDKKYIVSGEILSTVRNRLEQLRQETGEMNKQVFSLLLLNRFVAENPFDASGGSFNAGTFARQSVSKLLTEQLNRLADDLVAGVDLNFDVLSSEDYTTGERRDRTDLNVGLSKQLLNDRLTVSVGSNFELEGPSGSNQQGNNIAGDIALDYRISRDNRYLLRAYRKNEYQGVIDGYIIETGVGFIITVDYNRFREIFMSKRERDQRRQRRRQQREREMQLKEQTQEQQTPNSTTPVNK